MSAEQALAGRVLELVGAAAGAGAEAAVSVERRVLALTRFANSYIHQNLADDTTTIGIRLHTGGRTVTGSTNVTSADGLADLVSRTVEAVRHAPADPGWPGLAPPAPLAGQPSFDEATAAAPPDARAELVREFVAAGGGLETAGYCRTGYWASAFANSAGHAVSERTSEAAMDGIARRNGADGMARLASARLADLSGTELGTRAAAKARAGADPVELPPGRYQVVLEPAAVADLLSMLAGYGFNGRALAEKRTFAEPGADQFDRSVTIDDDPFRADSPGHAYDLEGTPRQRLKLVDAGVTTELAHDRRTAAQVGAASTGHGVRFFGAQDAIPGNIRLVPGDGAPAGPGPGLVVPSAAPLLAGVDRGLLVSDLWYTRVLDPKTLVVTGLTRNGVWLIEGGEITRPVRNLRFTQSYPQALGPGSVTGIGPVADLLPAGLLPSWPAAPPLHLASWNFTGGASG
ncbi:MAG: TldD/PmbA family protein [Natronosporangium sp.]